ncbi:MAG TPA: hypothetical protein PL117_11310 [Accumulibacter sp.]|uniref:hypothetical protein n=1 Tax=Accumulibacter sp. TaxID=2053492 RepID=UPI00261279C6|nr:hypothetical protein [Accumulibacter sp.]HRD92261.1 hypothetical protein [Accumulibacter sp.]HRF73353.1 hypothetical protein [Accumulibacter sp.]
MNRIALIADRLRLTAEIWLHRHGPWSLTLAMAFCSLLALALLLIPGLQSELAERQTEQQAVVDALQARAVGALAPPEPPRSTSERHYRAFRQILADESQVLPSIQAVLDSAVSHQLLATRAEYQRGQDPLVPAETLQMTVPVRGRYADVRRWIEEILATQPFVAVDELGFKREEIGIDQLEARLRLTIWHRPARSSERVGGVAAAEVER